MVANQWNHVAFTRQGPIGTLYLNGQVIATRTDLTVGMTEVGPTANNWLGPNGYGDAAYDGLIDDVRIYTSTLTAADIAAATFKAPGVATQERLLLGAGRDLPLNAWTHVAYTGNGSTGKIYFNGVLQATRTDFTISIGDVGVGGNTTANFIGGTSWGDARFDGLIDDFRLYGYELTAEQVTQLHAGRR